MTKKMWGGRFAEAAAAKVEEYTQSESFDRNLYREDIAGSKAHARMLGECGIIGKDEAKVIIQGLDTVLAEIEAGTFAWKRELEDVHMNIERRLTELVGPVGGKLHTARSRNDQVGLDFRLFVAARLGVWSAELARLVAVLADRAEEHKATLLPGCTHLQADGRCGIYETRPQVCRDHSNDYCELDAPREEGFDLHFKGYDELLEYCKKKFKNWGKPKSKDVSAKKDKEKKH